MPEENLTSSARVAAGDLADRETVVVGATLVAMLTSAAYVTARWGFVTSVESVLRPLGLSLFILTSPYWVIRLLPHHARAAHHLLTLGAILITALAGLTGAAARMPGAFISFTGLLSGAAAVISWLRRDNLRSRLPFVPAAFAIAIWAIGVIWTSRYKMPLYWETLGTTANVHHDPLYVAAMGNMISTYGVPSTGLDGVPYVHYHYGSAWLLSQWAALTDTDLLSFYSWGYVVVLLPLFLAAIGFLAIEAAAAIPKLERTRAQEGPVPDRGGNGVLHLATNRWAWLVLAVASIGVLPERALYDMAVWNAHVLISESYLAGLTVFLLVLAACLRLRAHLGTTRVLYAFLPIALAALGFLKVSLMVLLLAIVMYLALRTGKWKSRLISGALFLMVVICAATFSVVALTAHNGGISPFNFIRSSTPPGWHQFFPLIHFAWTVVYLTGRLWEEGAASFRAIKEAVLAGRLVDAELVLLLAVLGFLPGELLLIHGGSAIYFSDVQRWVAVALTMSRAGWWITLRRERQASSPEIIGTPERGKRIASMRLSTILAIFILAPFAFTMLANTVKPALRLARQNLSTRSAIIANADTGPSSHRSRLFDAAALARGIDRGRYRDLIEALRNLEARRASDMALFIPQSYRLFWEMFDRDDRCTYTPLVAPAVSGLALIDGMPYFGCVVTDQYNMNAYQARVRLQSPRDASDAAVCARATAKGFRRVAKLFADPAGAPVVRVMTCRKVV